MPVTFRKAAASDIDAVTAIYDAIITEEEAGRAATGWKRGIYPVRATAEAALTRGDVFVAELDGRVAAAAVLNQIQVDVVESHAGHGLLDRDARLIVLVMTARQLRRDDDVLSRHL